MVVKRLSQDPSRSSFILNVMDDGEQQLETLMDVKPFAKNVYHLSSRPLRLVYLVEQI